MRTESCVMYASGGVYILKWLKNLQVKMKFVELQKKWGTRKVAWCYLHGLFC